MNEIYRHRLDRESPVKPVDIEGVGGPIGDLGSGPNSGPKASSEGDGEDGAVA